jgi:hypothetical protein
MLAVKAGATSAIRTVVLRAMLSIASSIQAFWKNQPILTIDPLECCVSKIDYF